LEKDLALTDASMSYAGGASQSTVVIRNNPLAKVGEKQRGGPVPAAANGAWPKRQDGSPDFDKMNSLQRGAYDQWRLTRKYG
jgi:hypothetical protein